jgi:hypothetical protein
MEFEPPHPIDLKSSVALFFRIAHVGLFAPLAHRRRGDHSQARFPADELFMPSLFFFLLLVRGIVLFSSCACLIRARRRTIRRLPLTKRMPSQLVRIPIDRLLRVCCDVVPALPAQPLRDLVELHDLFQVALFQEPHPVEYGLGDEAFDDGP